MTHIELLRCHYNFARSHRALKIGREIRTPAMQAGLTNRLLTFRDIFSWTTVLIRLTMVGVTIERPSRGVLRAA